MDTIELFTYSYMVSHGYIFMVSKSIVSMYLYGRGFIDYDLVTIMTLTSRSV